MRYRSFGDSAASISAITVRLEATRQKSQAVDWRDFVFAALEEGVNAFEIGHTNVGMLNGVAEAFAAVDRRLLVVSWRTSLGDGPLDVAERARDLTAALGLSTLDLLTLELEAPLTDPCTVADLRRTEVARLLAAAGPGPVIDHVIRIRQFDGVVVKSDPTGGWVERNRIRAASALGMGVVAINVGVDVSVAEPPPAPKAASLLNLFARRPPPPPPSFRVNVPGWTEEQVAVAHALTDPAISTIMVQPNCTPTLEGLAWAVERDLPAGAQAQIEMSRFSGEPVPFERRRVQRA